jgi:DNA replication protein DnaC
MIQEQNPVAYQFAKKYLDNIMDQVNEGVGLYLYSIPNDLNRKGTGTGKSSVAATLVNEFVKLRVIEQAKGGRKIQTQPAIFLRVSEFQNVYNDQFRGSFDMQEAAAVKFGQMKRQMMNTELLVLDDIGLRDAKTLTNIIYEIIDHRNNEEKATVITSNVPVAMLGDLLSDQIASRIEEMCELVPFKGKDNRKKLL